jgi:type IV pilus assembly protein PilC
MISAVYPGLCSLHFSQQSKSEMSRLVAQILQDIEGGDTFAKALSKHPTISIQLHSIGAAGEVGGVLDDNSQPLG